jgi:hypothetical protein
VGAERLGEQQVEVAVGEAVGGVSREKDRPLKRVNLVAQLAGGGGELGGDAFAKFLEGAAGFLDAFEVGPDDLEEGVPVEFVAGVEGGADVGEGLAAGEEGGGGEELEGLGEAVPAGLELLGEMSVVENEAEVVFDDAEAFTGAIGGGIEDAVETGVVGGGAAVGEEGDVGGEGGLGVVGGGGVGTGGGGGDSLAGQFRLQGGADGEERLEEMLGGDFDVASEAGDDLAGLEEDALEIIGEGEGRGVGNVRRGGSGELEPLVHEVGVETLGLEDLVGAGFIEPEGLEELQGATVGEPGRLGEAVGQGEDAATAFGQQGGHWGGGWRGEGGGWRGLGGG